MKLILRYYRNLMTTHNRFLLLLEITFLVIFVVFILPFLNVGMGYAMQLWGQSYITAENALSFLTNPPTLLFLLITLLVFSFFLLLQMITMIHYCNSERMNHKPPLLHLLIIGFRKTIRCISSKNIALLLFTIFLFLYLNLPLLLVTTLPAKLDIPSGSSDAVFIKALLLLAYALIGFIAFRGMFTLHFCINEHQHFLDALEQSKALLQGRNLRTLRIQLTYNLTLIVGCFVVYYVLLLFIALFVFLFARREMVIPVFLSIYPRMNIVITLLFHMITFLTNLNIITTLYTNYREDDFTDILAKNQPLPKSVYFVKTTKNRHFVNGFLLFVIITGVINFYSTVRNDSFYLKDTFSGILISSHRGNSHVAPENTLPALENAIIARSDYAEIDVRQTKDGALVLLHDKSLLRTAGLNQYIWSLSLNELNKLDAGSWFSKEFIKTRIPKLEDALALCKGRIKLNIEVKSQKKDSGLEESLIALIAKYDYEHQCVVSSADYNVLVKIKQLNPNIKTGLIISATYGNFYDKVFVDFFSIRSRYITRQVVESAHRAGKEVHAWTVNTVSEIDRMKSVSVDCIITDNPTLTREILSQDDTSKTFIELLNRMLDNRSLYRFLPN